MKVTCVDQEIKKVFETGYYKIPRFQRPYSWEKENVDEFWNDVVIAHQGDYFIGCIVVYKKGEYSYLVDGQQRLTTITILLASLRNALRQHGFENLGNGVQRLISRSDLNDDEQFIIQPETSYPYFQDYIQSSKDPITTPDIGEEEGFLKSAFDQLAAYVNQMICNLVDPLAIKSTLENIRDKILSLKIIMVEVDNEDDAYVIFETLNTRGKDLAVADLVKNHLAKMVRQTNQSLDPIRLLWEEIRQNIDGIASDVYLDDFLHHYWLATHDFTTLRELFVKVKKYVLPHNAPRFVQDLRDASYLYQLIYDPMSGVWKREEYPIRDALEALANIFRVRLHVPMALSILREYKRGNISRKWAEKSLRAIENFHFMFTSVTSQRSSGGISSMYAMHARSVFSVSRQQKEREISGFLEKLKSRIPKRDEFIGKYEELKYSDAFSKQKKLVQYALRRYLDSKQQGVSYNYLAMSIEHLHPQSNHSISLDACASIGNLILVENRFNSEKLGDKSFDEKISLLKISNVLVDDSILAAKSWGDFEIRNRAKEMAVYSYDVIFGL